MLRSIALALAALPVITGCVLSRDPQSVGEIKTVTQSIPTIIWETLRQTAEATGDDFKGLERIQVELTADRSINGELGVTVPVGVVPVGASLGTGADRGIKIVIQIKNPADIYAAITAKGGEAGDITESCG